MIKVWWFSLMERQLNSFGKMVLKQPNYIVKRNKFTDVLEIHQAKFYKKIKIKNWQQMITNKQIKIDLIFPKKYWRN